MTEQDTIEENEEEEDDEVCFTGPRTGVNFATNQCSLWNALVLIYKPV